MENSQPEYGVLMDKKDTAYYPRHELPVGYSFAFYCPGMEEDWCRLNHEVAVETLEAAQSVFAEEFLPFPDELKKKCIFVLDEEGQSVATASLWRGNHFGKELQRIHWVAVSKRCQGMGLAKALVAKTLDVYNQLGYNGYIYLTSQTSS